MTLAEMIGSGTVTRADIAAHLDALGAETRAEECLILSRDQQQRLWRIASADPADQQDLLGPSGTAIYAGRNSLRLFSRFEKRFASHAGAVIGYNRHRLGWLTGPGYFIVSVGATGLLFDYRQVPSDVPAGWPAVTSNSRAFAKPVYGGLLDDVVWVARDVLVGSARRGDVSLDSHFVLARA